jgi:hypothetical protein
MIVKHRSQNGRPSLWKKLGSSNGFSQPFNIKTINLYIKRQEQKKTHLAHKTSPTPLAPECLHSLHSILNAHLAFLALGHPQPHMTLFAIRVTLVHRKPDIIVSKLAISGDVQLARASTVGVWVWVCARFGVGDGRREERIAAFCTEKMLFMIRPLPKRRIIKRDEPFINNRRLARITSWRKALSHTPKNRQHLPPGSKTNLPRDNPSDNTVVHPARTNSHAPKAPHTLCT